MDRLLISGGSVESTSLLAIWQDHPAKTPQFTNAYNLLVSHVEIYARKRYGCKRRDNKFNEELEHNLETLSELAGFTTVDTWHAKPTSTLRFMEIIAKLYASTFTIGQILFLFTVGPHVLKDDPFLISDNVTDPLALPANSPFDLWCLRRKLLDDCLDEEDLNEWTWDKIQEVLVDMGYSAGKEDSLKSLAEHFFPFVLETDVPEQSRQF